jgi:hypothetical protein
MFERDPYFTGYATKHNNTRSVGYLNVKIEFFEVNLSAGITSACGPTSRMAVRAEGRAGKLLDGIPT